MFDILNKRIWVAGHNGMVGRAICKALGKYECEVLTEDRDGLDLKNQKKVDNWVKDQLPDAIIICAAKVGGIEANRRYPAEFIYDNISIQTNIIHSAYKHNVKKLLFLGSSCIYPKLTSQPITEDALLSGELEATNQWYALAKIAGIKLCQAYRKQYGCDFISAMPTNLYGPHDNFDLETSHVVPALIRKSYEAWYNRNSFISVWGSGLPKREFLHVDDCADGLLFLLQNYSSEMHVNLGSGEEITIIELVKAINQIVGFEGEIVFETEKPDGTPRKVLDVSVMTGMGWKSQVRLEDGLRNTINWYKQQVISN